MTTLNFPDLAKKIGVDTDPAVLVAGSSAMDWSRTLQRVLMTGTKQGQTPLVPNGTQDDPTIVRVPELYRSVSIIEPYRATARHIHVIADAGAGFHWPTLGPGHNGNMDILDWANQAAHGDTPSVRIAQAELKARYRGRFGLGGVGGHGWRYEGILKGPKLAGMPPLKHIGSMLEGQHGFWGKDFGHEITVAEAAAGVRGWSLKAEITDWYGDGVYPGTVRPHGVPAWGLDAEGCYFGRLGRVGFSFQNVRNWAVRRSVFGPEIASSVTHSETWGLERTGEGRLEENLIYGGDDFVHISGEHEFVGLLVRANERFDPGARRPVRRQRPAPERLEADPQHPVDRQRPPRLRRPGVVLR